MSESSRPLIAVVAYHLDGTRVARWPEGGYGVPGLYLDALRRAGARTAILAPGERGEPEEVLEPFDGLLLVGGGDIDPARYGGEPNEHVYGVEPDRDEAEIALVHAAERLSLPTLCICRGIQVMNVAYGGTLVGHLPEVPGLQVHGVPLDESQTIHDVTPEPGSRLAAVTDAVRASHGKVPVVPEMAPYTTDGSYFRAAGIPTYGVSAIYLKPSDELSHGLNERVPVDIFYAGLTHWYILLRDVGMGARR